MSRYLIRLVAVLAVFLILTGCIAGAENIGLPADSQAAATASLAATAPPSTPEPAATTEPAATAAAAFDCENVAEIPFAECETLVAFYEATGGPEWVDNTGWLASNTPCSWFGISCSSAHVGTLGLFFNRLSGRLQADLAGLPALRVLDLHNNQITGTIPPELGRLAALEYIDLSANQLSEPIPASLGALAKLQTLNLSNNSLSGPIPTELGRLAGLRSLALSHNLLSGPIPEALANLSALESLHLGDNMLEGTIPFGLGQSPALSLADLSFNQLSGSTPSALFELPDHQLWGNRLDGTIFSDGSEQNVNFLGATFSFNPGTAGSVWPELVPAGLIGPGPGLPWDPPEHIVFTLAGAQPQDHNPMGLYVPAEAQIQIYPAEGLNEEVQPIVAALQQILAERPDLSTYEVTAAGMNIDDPELGLLPPSNAQQVFRSQAAYVDFIGGSGVRYLTMLSQGLMPVSNQDLFYTFQGLTDDGTTYVAVYYPVSLPGLPDSPQLDEADFNALVEDWAGYLNDILAMLNGQEGAAFTPDLTAIDALITTISVAGITPPSTIEGEGITPKDGETVGIKLLLQWVEVPGAVSYEVIVLDDAAFPPQVVIDETVTEPKLALETPLEPGHYSWTVRAMAGDGTVLAELNRAFTVETTLPANAGFPTITLDTGRNASDFRTETIGT
jgi:hypothetical protein